MQKFYLHILSLYLLFSMFYGCTWDKVKPGSYYKGYPEEIGEIMLDKCATSGCHNEQSKDAAGGLDLSSWERLFKGTEDNSAVVPYRSDLSFLSFFINDYPDLGQVLEPRMPYNSSPLSRNEVQLILDWIDNGAPNSEGYVKFSDDPNRKKFYITNQGCDLVAVFDLETGLLMRYVDVGSKVAIESPHMVEVSPDGAYWIVCFYAGNILQKYSTENDELLGTIEIGDGSWNTFAFSPDSRYVYAVSLEESGSIVIVDMESMTLEQVYQGAGLLVWPHGSVVNESGSLLYITAQEGNYIYKIDITDISSPVFEEVVVSTGETPNISAPYDPHEIYFSPDYSNYFVTCQGTNEVRVFNAVNDSLIAIIPVGVYPQEISFSEQTNMAFVTCTEDNVTFPNKTGSVSIIDYVSFVHLKSIHTGYQPHGVAVDDYKQQVYVVNRNVSFDGPTPHHTTDCGGRNGYVTIIDMNTLELVPGYKAELSVDPYFISIRN